MKLVPLVLAALFALTGVSMLAPSSSAQPCNMAGCCPPTALCPCFLCGLPPIVIQCGPTQTVSEAPWVGASVGTCGGSAYACTDPAYRIPTDPHSQGGLYCGSEAQFVLP